MRTSLSWIAASLALSACDQPPPKVGIVGKAWVQMPAVAGRPGTAYFTLNQSGCCATLSRITSPQVERIELHETRMEGRIARMRPMSDVPFDGSGDLHFVRGEKHAMLFGITPRAKERGVSLTFHFTGAPPLTVDADLREPEDVFIPEVIEHH